MVVAEALPVVGVAVADSGAGRGEAVGDDAVRLVSYMLYALRGKILRTHQWQCRSQIANQQKPKRLLRWM